MSAIPPDTLPEADRPGAGRAPGLGRALGLAAGLGAAFVLWRFSSKAVADALVWGAFAWALLRRPRAAEAWRSPAGMAFAGLLAFTGLTVPLSTAPLFSLRDLVGLADVFAGAFAIAAVFGGARRLECALGCSAVALGYIFAGDLARLRGALGPRMWKEGHTLEPFAIGHSPNTASMLSAAALLVLLFLAWRWRRRALFCALALFGALIQGLYVVALASRSAQIALAGTVAAAGYLLPGRRAKAGWTLALAAGILLVGLNLERINPRFFDRLTMHDGSDRLLVWSHTWKLSQARPVMGYGYGERVFESVYYRTEPPHSMFHFPHPHNYWLAVLFAHGWLGVALHAGAWSLLGVRLLRRIAALPALEARALPGAVALLLLLIHLFGLIDQPSSVLRMMLIWLIPAALIASGKNGDGTKAGAARPDAAGLTLP